MKPRFREPFLHRFALWVSSIVIIMIAISRLRRYYPSDIDASGNSDAFHTYLPGARRWLEHGSDFLLNDPFSTRVAPLGYLWPALWQADVTAVRWANGGLFVLSALIMAHAARRLGGWLGAAVAVLLLLYHPGIAYYMPKVLTEPLYLFGLMLFSWSLIEIFLAPETVRNRWFVLGSAGLAITLLTRPVLQLMAVAAMAATATALLTSRFEPWRVCLRKLLAMLVLASAVPAAVLIKNGIQFDLWSLGTGTGAGLYYGVNPLRIGHEPTFMGFEYDIGEVVRAAEPMTGGEPLDRTADRIERAAAMSVVQNTHWLDSLRFFALKLRSWLLYSTPELGFDSNLRKFRLFELLCIAAGILAWFIRRRRSSRISASQSMAAGGIGVAAIALGVGVALMTLQLAPLLYNTRYNAGFLEPWILLLTSAGIGAFMPAWETRHHWSWRAPRWWQALLLVALIGASIALTNRAKRHEILPLDAERLGPVTPVLLPSHIGRVSANASPRGAQQWRQESEPITLEVPLQSDHAGRYPSMEFMDGVWRFYLRVSAPNPSRCRIAGLKLEYSAGEIGWPRPELRIIADGQWRAYAIHGNHNLRPLSPGRLWLKFNCEQGTEVSWGGAELLRSTMPDATRALWRNGVAINPYSALPWSTVNAETAPALIPAN